MSKLIAALRARDQQPGSVVNQAENVAWSSTEPQLNVNNQPSNPD